MVFKSQPLAKRAKRKFGIAVKPVNVGYILRDGMPLRFVPFRGALGRLESAHVRIGAVMTPEEKRRSGKGVVNNFLSQTGAIRAQVRDNRVAFEIRKKASVAQMEQIKSLQDNKPIFVDVTDDNGKSIKSGKFNEFSSFQNWMESNNFVR